MATFLIFSLFLLMAQSAQGVTTSTQNGYTVTVNDTTNGQIPSSTIQNQITLFFQLYPSMSASYNGAPKTVTLFIDPNTASNSVGASTTYVKLSVARLQSSPNDSGYLQFALNFMLSAFYTTGPTTTTKATTTTAATSTGQSGMTDALRQSVLSIHNNYRSQLAKGNVTSAGGKMPTAANMNQLTYSIAQENAAANWAVQCIDQHTPNNPYGQNKCTGGGQWDFGTFVTTCLPMWWNEVQQWPNTADTTLTDANWAPVGHWSQMAWATAKSVGCAMKVCPSAGTLLFCNYDSGNLIPSKIYNTGSTCSQCSTSCLSNGLCQ